MMANEGGLAIGDSAREKGLGIDKQPGQEVGFEQPRCIGWGSI